MRRRSRKLSADDKAVWSHVTQGVTPLARVPAPVAAAPAAEQRAEDAPRRPAPPAEPAATVAVASSPATPPLPRARPEPRTRVTLAPDPMQEAGAQPPAMDARAYTRLKRGKLAPEARIDLHGMTAERAHGALRHFIADAHARGLRLVLVITGKGRVPDDHASPARRGILRNAVPVWLAQPPLAGMVLQLAPAHIRHGGGGAYYVYLRRRR